MFESLHIAINQNGKISGQISCVSCSTRAIMAGDSSTFSQLDAAEPCVAMATAGTTAKGERHYGSNFYWGSASWSDCTVWLNKPCLYYCGSSTGLLAAGLRTTSRNKFKVLYINANVRNNSPGWGSPRQWIHPWEVLHGELLAHVKLSV